MDFNELPIENKLKNSIKFADFKTPTPIQSKSIPRSLKGKDILGTAQTGTGKTAAFGIPSIHLTDLSEKTTQTLILCPTRELCMQVANDLKQYSKYVDNIGIVSIYCDIYNNYFSFLWH